jgi:hypothetical protein
MRRQADFFCGKLNGITFPYSSGCIHFVSFLLKLLGTKNSMIVAINHPTCKNKTEAKKFVSGLPSDACVFVQRGKCSHGASFGRELF